MNQERKNAIAAYEHTYGRTEPLPCSSMGPNKNYIGSQIQEGNIVISFSSRLSNDTMCEIEEVFRNRLGRKISFLVSDGQFTVLVNPLNREDAGEYLAAAQILDRCYRGKEQSVEQKAEYKAYLAGEDWRDEQVVQRYITAIYAGK